MFKFGHLTWTRQVSRAVWVLLGLTASAPGATAQDVRIGGTIGVSRVWYSGVFDGERLGLTFGPTFTKDIRRTIALHAEVLYTQRGMKENAGYGMSTAYLEFPLLAEFTISQSGSVRPTAAIGIAPAVEVSCGGVTVVPQLFALPGPPTRELDCDGERSDRTDVGGVLGLGLHMDAGVVVWSLALRYTHGLNDLYDRSPYLKRANRGISVLVGIGR